jgi:hypothetical protein
MSAFYYTGFITFPYWNVLILEIEVNCTGTYKQGMFADCCYFYWGAE